MNSLILDTEEMLRKLEAEFNNIIGYYKGKQADRVFSNRIWVMDKLESNLLKKAKPLHDSLKKIKSIHNPQGLPSIQFDAPISHAGNFIKMTEELYQMYKMDSSYPDIKLKLKFTIPQLNQEIQHLRNRFMIIKGNLTRQKSFDANELF